MKTTIFQCFLVIVFLANAAGASHQMQGEVQVKVRNLRNDHGEVRIALFSSADGFPDQAKKAWQIQCSLIKDHEAEAVFTQVPYGIYAIGILHDENKNAKMEMNWLSMPLEGYGASNDARGFFGPPSFQAAQFEVKHSSLELVINVNY